MKKYCIAVWLSAWLWAGCGSQETNPAVMEILANDNETLALERYANWFVLDTVQFYIKKTNPNIQFDTPEASQIALQKNAASSEDMFNLLRNQHKDLSHLVGLANVPFEVKNNDKGELQSVKVAYKKVNNIDYVLLPYDIIAGILNTQSK